MPSNDSDAEKEKNTDIVMSVLNGSAFKIRPDEEKLAIIQKGRPLPNLNISKSTVTSSTPDEGFQSSWYSIYKWLCGSKNYNKFFCWPCLLMRPESSSWCSTGNNDLKKLSSLASKHAACKSHLKAIAEYDEVLTNFGLYPEYADELSFKLKEEEETSFGRTAMNDLFLNESKVKEIGAYLGSNSRVQSVSNAESSIKAQQSSNVPMNQTVNTEITFKTWQEIRKNNFPVSKSKLLEDIKLFKWKKKIAQQELKNARLTEEKLRFEIEVLRAKVEYYKCLKEEINKTHEKSGNINSS